MRIQNPRALGGTIVALALVVALATATSAAAGTSGARAGPSVVHLPDGSTVSVTPSGEVTERNRQGQLLAQSFCGSASAYTRWATFMTGFATAVERGDRTAVAAEIDYPLVWTHGPGNPESVPNRAALLAAYTRIFSPAVVASIRQAEPRAVFCKDISDAMLGSGVVWGEMRGRQIGIITVNGGPA